MQASNNFLSDLLPYDPNERKNAGLKTAIKEYRLLLSVFLEAEEAWSNQELIKFDSLVGENACQIRAIQIAIAAVQDYSNNGERINQIRCIFPKIETLLAHLHQLSFLMLRGISLKLLLEQEQLELFLTDAELFRLQSFILTELKEWSIKDKIILFRNERIHPKKLMKYGDVSTSFSEKLVSKLRRMLACSSVQYVRQLAYQFQSPHLIKMVSEIFTTNHNTLPCIPMFWTYSIILRKAMQKRIPLCLHAIFLCRYSERDNFERIEEEKIIYDCDRNGYYVPVKSTEIDLNKPALIFQGIVCSKLEENKLRKDKWRELILRKNIVDVILAGATDHRQYPDPSLDRLFDSLNDEEYKSYKSLAKKEGFSSENPTTFFIQHVYAIYLREIIRKMHDFHEGPLHSVREGCTTNSLLLRIN